MFQSQGIVFETQVSSCFNLISRHGLRDQDNYLRSLKTNEQLVTIGGGTGGGGWGGAEPFAPEGEDDYMLTSIYRILKIPYHCRVTFVRKNHSTRFYTVRIL